MVATIAAKNKKVKIAIGTLSELSAPYIADYGSQTVVVLLQTSGPVWKMSQTLYSSSSL